MKEYEQTILRVKEWFRKNSQTNWGKNQIAKVLDDMETKIKKEKETDYKQLFSDLKREIIKAFGTNPDREQLLNKLKEIEETFQYYEDIAR